MTPSFAVKAFNYSKMLEEEFLSPMDGLDDRASAWLKQQGVPKIALDMWPGPVGVASIEAHPMGCFEFVPDTRRAFIQPVLSGGEFTDIVDLVAWHPDQPGQCWARHYSGVPLGIDQLDRAELLGESLLLHPTPLDWLRARRRRRHYRLENVGPRFAVRAQVDLRGRGVRASCPRQIVGAGACVGEADWHR